MDKIIATPSSSHSNGRCCFCIIQKGIYRCPRCRLNYCSVNCYRCEKHSKCSEEFYKGQVMSHLQTNQVDDDVRNQIVELLVGGNLKAPKKKRKRIKRLYGDEEYALTEEEWSKFDSLVESGGIFDLLPANFWDPWYIKFPVQSVIDDEDEFNFDDSSDDFPPYPADLPELESLSKKPASPLIKLSVIQVIFSYCWISRFYTGDLINDPEEVLHNFLSVSFLDQKQVMQPTTELCLQFSCRKMIEEYKIGISFILKIIDDLIYILNKGNRLILRCLVDICRLCRDARKKSKNTSYKAIEKKICFYMSWCVENEKLVQQEIPSIEIESLSMNLSNCSSKQKPICSDKKSIKIPKL